MREDPDDDVVVPKVFPCQKGSTSLIGVNRPTTRSMAVERTNCGSPPAPLFIAIKGEIFMNSSPTLTEKHLLAADRLEAGAQRKRQSASDGSRATSMTPRDERGSLPCSRCTWEES